MTVKSDCSRSQALISIMYGQLKLYTWMVFFLTVLLHVLLKSGTQAASISEDAICARHFSHKVQKCTRSFFDLYQSHHQAQKHGIRIDDLITKHLCFEYEKTLQCLHSSLSSCPTLKNVQRVQHKLSAEWVTDVNHLCRIQSETSDEEDNETDESDEMEYLVNTTDESETKVTDSEQLQPFKNQQKSYAPRENFVGKKSNNPLWSRVIKVRQLMHSKQHKLETRHDNSEYKIYNIITNYTSSAKSGSLISWTLWIVSALFCVSVL